jgi:opacity protein-like surface antigen
LADEVSNTTLMLNAVFDIPVSQNIALSLGAGAGADWIATDLGPLSSASDSKTTFAYQLIAGLAFGIGDGLDLTVNYRYLDVSGTDDLLAGTNDIGSSIGGALIRVDEVSSSTVSVGLRFEL